MRVPFVKNPLGFWVLLWVALPFVPLSAAGLENTSVEKEVNHAWTRIEAWLVRNAPAALATLNGPALGETIAAAEKEMGLLFPPDLRASLRRHDGQNTAFPAVFHDGLAALPVARILDSWRFRVKRMVPMFGDRDDFKSWKKSVSRGVIFIGGPVKARLANSLWIPFADSNGDVFWFVDLDPAPGGTRGQVIQVDPEGTTWEVRAPNLLAHLQTYAAALEKGDYTVDSYGQITPISARPAPQGLPDYLK